jgi:hypothetical protein
MVKDWARLQANEWRVLDSQLPVDLKKSLQKALQQPRRMPQPPRTMTTGAPTERRVNTGAPPVAHVGRSTPVQTELDRPYPTLQIDVARALKALSEWFGASLRRSRRSARVWAEAAKARSPH